MGVDIWTDTVVIKHKGKLYPFWRLADNNLFEYGYSGTQKRVQSWTALADHLPERNLWAMPEDTSLDKIKEIAEKFFFGLLPNHIWKEGETDKAVKHFGFYSGIYYNSLGESGNVSLRRYVNRIARAFQRAVTVEQLVCKGGRDCDEHDQKLINSVKNDLNMLPTFEFLRTNEKAKKGIYYFLDSISRNVVDWNGKGTIERFIATNFFRKDASKGEKKYGVQLALHRDKEGNPVFSVYVAGRGRRNMYTRSQKTLVYSSRKSAEKVVEDVKRGRYARVIDAQVITLK